MRRLVVQSLMFVAMIGAAATVAHAASPLGIGTAEPSFQTTGLLGGWLGWINQHQQAFYRSLTGALKAMREDSSALTPLLGLSFAYGIFHAAGPGHGKAVISSYMIANETELKRGIAISFVSAFLQGVVAIAIVAAAYFVLRGTGITMTAATNAMEIASFGMVIAFGVWLLLRKLKSIWVTRQAPVSAGLFDAAMSTGPATTTGLSFRVDALDHDHATLSPGAVCADCGMTHLPDPKMLSQQDFRLREAWSAIVAVGLRPCSGALLVMTFALLNGLYLGGALSVFAMALGTAITVSALAIIAVSAKSLAVRISGPGSATAKTVATTIEIAGALFVILLGAVLLAAALHG